MLTDGRTTDGRRTDGRTDDGVIGILIAHLGAFGSGELKSLAIFHTSSGKAGIKAGAVLSVFYSRYRFLKIAKITSSYRTSMVYVQI